MIYNFLEGYAKSGIYPFHMPGHKRNRQFLPENLLDFDITEIPGADNLNSPDGIIMQFQNVLSKKYNADDSILLVNGSSSGIVASILYAAPGEGDTVIISRNAHRSAYSALTLSGANPVYINPEFTPYGFAGGITPETVYNAVRNSPSAKAVFITSPTYEGITSDIYEISKIVHENGMVLIVDEAHGAHFAFSGYFPKSALDCGADIVVHSLHKTLPVLGQVSVLHIKGGAVDRNKLRQLVSFLQTSSPSYILMAQADFCFQKLENERFIFSRFVKLLSHFRHNALEFNKIKLFSESEKNKYGIFDIDSSKLVFTLLDTPLTGKQLEAAIRDNYSVQLEMSGAKHIIAMASAADIEEGYARLERGISEISRLYGSLKPEKQHFNSYIYTNNPVIAIPPKKAFESKTEEVCLSMAEGRVAGEFIIPYPPGIPLIVPGERITCEILKKIGICLNGGITVIGAENLNKKKIRVIKL